MNCRKYSGKIFPLIFFLSFQTAAARSIARDSTYFPLNSGNQWTFADASRDPPLSSGVYVSRLAVHPVSTRHGGHAGMIVETRKMILIK